MQPAEAASAPPVAAVASPLLLSAAHRTASPALQRQGSQPPSPPPQLPIASRQAEADEGATNWGASQAAQASTGAAAAGDTSNQFMGLLESLEARVDFMSQMQHTRAAIQKRAKALEGLKSNEDSSAPGSEGGSASLGTTTNSFAWQPTVEVLPPPEDSQAMPNPDRRSPRPVGWSPTDVPPGTLALEAAPTMPLQPPKAGEANAELWAQFQDQRNCISRLTTEVEGMRRQLLALGASNSPSASTTTSWSEVSGAKTKHERERAVALDQSLHAPVPPPGPDLMNTSGLTPPMKPFSHDLVGVNLELSGDGYSAVRTRGCRQAAAVGIDALMAGARGYFFEVTVEETVSGWVGGLGIGVTATSPHEIRRVPDKAWRMPSTYMVGYWGCIFLDGVERRTSWRSDTLAVGSVVGLLVTREGDLLVFVDNHPVVRLANAVPGAATKKLYPVIDVFAATRAITLSQRADPPPPPWCVETETHSPPTSPRGSSLCEIGAATPKQRPVVPPVKILARAG